MSYDYNKLCLLKNINKSIFKNLNCTSSVIQKDFFNDTYSNFISTIGIYIIVLFIVTIPVVLIYNCCNAQHNKKKQNNINKNNKDNNESETIENTENTENAIDSDNTENSDSLEDTEITELSEDIFISNKNKTKPEIMNQEIDKDKLLNIVFGVISKNNILTIENINKLIKNIKNHDNMREPYKNAVRVYKTFDSSIKNSAIYKKIYNKLLQAKINKDKIDNIIILFMTISLSKL